MSEVSKSRDNVRNRLEVGGVLYTATVLTRHNPKCKYAGTDNNGAIASCQCRKAILTYNGATQKPNRFSAKTRSWTDAKKRAAEWLDQYDPDKIERAKREAQSVTVEKAVFSYLQDMITRLGDNGTVSRARTLFGDVDADGNVKRDGKLFSWLNAQRPRPTYLSDLTVPHLSAWRSAWGYGSDLTAKQSWSEVVTFFKFCVSQGWLEKSPAAGLRYPKVVGGNRTGTFSDEQYAAILEASRGGQRLHTFLELLRWSGMALVDAVEFNRKSLDQNGVLRYIRIKTKKLATVQLPENVVALLRSVPLDVDNTPEQPFLRKGVVQITCIHEWRDRLQDLFQQAGVTTVKTEVRNRVPHPHMLRDTCAVWYLCHGASLHGVAKILGDSVATVTKHYLPFVQELETAHNTEIKNILAANTPKPVGNVLAFAR